MISASPRVLLVTHYFADHGGGVEVVAGQLAKHLALAHPDWRFDWCASAEAGGRASGAGLAPSSNRVALAKDWKRAQAPPHVPAPNISLHAMANWNGIEARLGVPYPLWSPAAVARLWRLVGACDVAHLHDFAYAGNALAALFCKVRGKPYLVTQHIGWVPYRSALLRAVLNGALKTLGRRVLGGASGVIFVSDEVRRFFARRMKLRAQTIANGVDGALFRPACAATRAQLRRQSGLHEDKPVALFVGRFVEKKGVPLVLELAGRTPEVQWVLVGGGPLDPGAGAPPNVRVWRGLRGAGVARAMQLADVLVLPSRGEGFPLVVQEALSCGTPVVVEKSLARALPGVAPWIETEALGAPDDGARWTERVRAVVAAQSAPDVESRRCERASWARARWSWEECARRYGELMEALSRAQ